MDVLTELNPLQAGEKKTESFGLLTFKVSRLSLWIGHQFYQIQGPWSLEMTIIVPWTLRMNWKRLVKDRSYFSR